LSNGRYRTINPHNRTFELQIVADFVDDCSRSISGAQFGGRTACRQTPAAIVSDVAQAKVNQATILDAIDEDVLHLKIAMDDRLLTLQICENGNNRIIDKAEGGLVSSSASSIPSGCDA
jgi:hypothetical protein